MTREVVSARLVSIVAGVTHNSVVSLGRPLGSADKPLLLQRTTVSRHEHSAGQRNTGEQLFSSFPDGRGCLNRKNRELPWLQTKSSNISLTIVAGKILDSNVLDGNLFQEIGILAARVTRDDALSPQPITEPGQVTVTVEGVGQKVAEEDENSVGNDNGCV